jgi:hypothetical protein
MSAATTRASASLPIPVSARGADPLGQVALRHELEFDLPGPPGRVEMPGIGLARERAHDLADPPVPDQRGQAVIAVARVVADHGQVPGVAGQQRLDQRNRLPGRAEPADQDGRAIRGVGDSLQRATEDHDPAHDEILAWRPGKVGKGVSRRPGPSIFGPNGVGGSITAARAPCWPAASAARCPADNQLSGAARRGDDASAVAVAISRQREAS